MTRCALSAPRIIHWRRLKQPALKDLADYPIILPGINTYTWANYSESVSEGRHTVKGTNVD